MMLNGYTAYMMYGCLSIALIVLPFLHIASIEVEFYLKEKRMEKEAEE